MQGGASRVLGTIAGLVANLVAVETPAILAELFLVQVSEVSHGCGVIRFLGSGARGFVRRAESPGGCLSVSFPKDGINVLSGDGSGHPVGGVAEVNQGGNLSLEAVDKDEK